MDSFYTLEEFNKQYNSIRKDIINRYKIYPNLKIKWTNKIRLYEKINNQWLLVATTKQEMLMKIESCIKLRGKGEFMLESIFR